MGFGFPAASTFLHAGQIVQAEEGGSFGTVEVRPNAKDDWAMWLIYGGAALLLLLMFTGGKR
jgi:hypothetical protein